MNRSKLVESRLVCPVQYDALTGLPNRILLVSRLAHAIRRVLRQRSLGAVIYLGLDHFQNINLSLGRAVGDQLLQAVAQRLKNRLRNVDTLTRWGGDEFIVVLDVIPGAEAAATVAQSVLAELRQPFALSDGTIVHTSGSIGIALFSTGDETPEQLIARAGETFHQVKRSGQGGYAFSAPV